MNINLMENLFWILLTGTMCAWLTNRFILHFRDEKSQKIRCFVWGLLILGLGIPFGLFAPEPFYYLWVYVQLLTVCGALILHPMDSDDLVVCFSVPLVLTMSVQLGALLMESFSLLVFQVHTALLPVFWKTAHRTADTAAVFLFVFVISEIRISKLDLGRRYNVRTETENIIMFFYLLFLCYGSIFLPEPWSPLYQNALGMMFSVCAFYFTVTFIYGLVTHKEGTKKAIQLESLMDIQREQMRLLEEHSFQLSAIRHDCKNIFLTAEQLIAQGDLQEAIVLLEGYQESLELALHPDLPEPGSSPEQTAG